MGASTARGTAPGKMADTMADLWDRRREENRAAAEPLAVRMRPRVLEDFLGQEHFLGEGQLLRRMLES